MGRSNKHDDSLPEPGPPAQEEPIDHKLSSLPLPLHEYSPMDRGRMRGTTSETEEEEEEKKSEQKTNTHAGQKHKAALSILSTSFHLPEQMASKKFVRPPLAGPRVFEQNSSYTHIDDRTIKVCCWNLRSFNSISKLTEIIKAKPDIVMLQEIWNPKKDVLDLLGGTQVIKRRSDVHGGTLTAWNKSLMEPSNIPQDINPDSLLSKVTIAGNRTMWIGSIYIPVRSKKLMLETFANIKNAVPEYEWSKIFLAGDFNIDIQNPNDTTAEALRTVVKQMGLSIYKTTSTHGGKTIDFFITGRDIKLSKVDKINTIKSDHAIIVAHIEIPKPKISNASQIPNKKAATLITENSLKESSNSIEFFRKVDKQMKKRQYNILKVVKKPKRNTELLDKIVQIQEEDEDLAKIVQEYWNDKVDHNEQDRYSKVPKEIMEAFKFLKRTYKYHEFDKRDGSIVNKILLEDGTIEHRKEEVDKLLIGVMKDAQLRPDQPQYDKLIPFPKLPELTQAETRQILDKLSTGKAIAYDGITDCLFEKKHREKAAKVFKDFWTSDWEKHTNGQEHFSTRLIPLNKVHPKVPTKEKFRPISVSSPIVRLRETRLLPKLSDYMAHKMHRGQTGFVSGQGILVNQMRLVERVTERISAGKKTYGIFIDFSNAYNTILHTKLFQRLKGILDEEEIQLLKAMYSRIKIRVGNEKFTPNIGVAQGSTISPALFNIYAEDLYKTLDNAGVNPQDQMGYADDLFILCYSLNNMRQVIKVLKTWSAENNLGLNAAKSGVMEFLPRKGRATMKLTIGEDFEGIPVVACYKYLGMWVDQKLYMGLQLDQIKKKADWISIKLWPVLNRVSMEYCKNLWTILIRPLFEQLSILYYCERGKSNKEQVQQVLRHTFRRFTLLKKNISNEVIHDLMQFDINERANQNMAVTKHKWEVRMGRELYVKDEPIPSTSKTRRILPKELQQILNLLAAKCPICQQSRSCSKEHMEHTHQILIPTYKEMIETIERKTGEAKDNKLSRKHTMEYIGNFIKIYIDRMNQFLSVQNA